MIGLTFQDDVERIGRILEDIRKRDPTFRYRFHRLQPRDKLSNVFDIILVIANKNKDQAMQRGLWLTNKVAPLRGKNFWVKPKD